MIGSDQQISIVEKIIVIPRLADFPLPTAEKLCFAGTERNGQISNTVFGVCQNPRVELLCDDALACNCRDCHGRRASILGHARAGSVRGRALNGHRRVRRGADGHDEASIRPPEETVEALSSMAQAQLRLVAPATTSPVLLR
jgi:hypothetical protein